MDLMGDERGLDWGFVVGVSNAPLHQLFLGVERNPRPANINDPSTTSARPGMALSRGLMPEH